MVSRLPMSGDILEQRVPTHPGTILREDILPALPMSQARIAEILHLSRQHFSRILNGQNPVTAETAVKLGRFFNNNPQFWLNLQNKYDVWEARQKLRMQLSKIGEARAQMASSLALREDKESEAGGV